VRALAVERLPDHHREGELIGADVGLAEELLGRHVGRRADRGPGARESVRQDVLAPRAGPRAADRRRCRAGPVHAAERRTVGIEGDRRHADADLGALVALGPGQPEVGDLGHAGLGQEHVLRLEVAMHQPGGVGGGQALPGGPTARQRLAPRPTRSLEPAPQGATGQILHRHEDVVAVAPDGVDGDDVWMGQPRHRGGLALQAIEAGAGVVQLDRDRAIERGVVGQVDHAHAAGAEPTLDAEGLPDDRPRGELGLGRRGRGRGQRGEQRVEGAGRAGAVEQRRRLLGIDRGVADPLG
jgi:hypothetical protein